jgi:hypothetical protein
MDEKPFYAVPQVDRYIATLLSTFWSVEREIIMDG